LEFPHVTQAELDEHAMQFAEQAMLQSAPPKPLGHEHV